MEKAKQEHTCESRSKNRKIKLGFLEKFMCMHELARMRITKPTCAGKIMCMQVSAQKP